VSAAAPAALQPVGNAAVVTAQPRALNQTVAAPLPAPSSPSPEDAAATLTTAQKTIAQVQNLLPTTSNDDQLAQLGARVAGAQGASEAIIAARTRDLARVDGALKHAARRARHAGSAGDSALFGEQRSLQTQMRQAQAVAAKASAAFNLVAERRRESFSARVLERSASPLSPDFWGALANASSADFHRLLSVGEDASETAIEASEPFGLLVLVFGVAVAMILLIPVRRWLEALARHRLTQAPTPEHQGATGLPLSARAVWIAAVDVGLPVLAMTILHLCGQWAGLLSEKAEALFDAAVVAVTWAAAILALGRVLATDRETDRRLLNLPDAIAGRARVALWAVALITGAGFLMTRLNYVIGASVAETIATNCLLSLAYACAAGLMLVGLGRGRDASDTLEVNADVDIAPVWSIASFALTVAIAITLGAVLLGYTTLAALVSNQIFWLSVLAAATYLLLRFADDLIVALFQPRGWAAHVLFTLFRLRRTTLGQLGVLISAALQLIIIIAAISLALTPFGQSGNLLLARIGRLGQAFHIGSVTISPPAVAAGLATLALGIGVVHIIRNWVVRRYLPVTDWDAGLRNSVSTGVGYLGVGVSVVCALAAMGLGFQQIALIASALSVGIGFGLQQIVQNFVSGVILLIERPVKVGDWVMVDGVEGDVRRIRVRATEIQTFDRSTVIVPNSELITKSVQNKTLGKPRARIQLQVSIANPADAQKARDLILSTGAEQPDVLPDPAPTVYIDSLATGGGVNFNCYFYVEDPRILYKTRSDLYFRVLHTLEAQNVAFMGAGGPTNVILEPGPMLESILAARPPARRAG
jgi:small-conductance mechanosensitive channel